jgi:hypothetical protein
MDKVKLGGMEYIKDSCIICNNSFLNPGTDSGHPFFCSKECSAEFIKPDRIDVIKQLYKDQFEKRKKG